MAKGKYNKSAIPTIYVVDRRMIVVVATHTLGEEECNKNISKYDNYIW